MRKSRSVAPSAGCEPGLRSATRGENRDKRHLEERQGREGPCQGGCGLGAFAVGAVTAGSRAQPGTGASYRCGDNAAVPGNAGNLSLTLSLCPEPAHPFAVPNGCLCSELCFT